MFKQLVCSCVLFSTSVLALTVERPAIAGVIDFTDGIVFFNDGTSTTTAGNRTWHNNVDYYIEDGFKIDFLGGLGTIGTYYGDFPGSSEEAQTNDVIHVHWHDVETVEFSKVDGTAFDLNYFDLTSNTISGGGRATGQEESYITASNGSSFLLPSSDWGFNSISTGQASDGVERLWLDDTFNDITSFAVYSLHAFCFGLDNFFIDVPPPPNPDDPILPDPIDDGNDTSVPEPGILLMLLGGLMGLRITRRQQRIHTH